MDLQGRWYRSSHDVMTMLLLPLAWTFQGVVSVRRFLYRSKFKKTHRFSVPVIVIGNITLGGTGKTPIVIWLANFLKEQGFFPGIVSRGVGGLQQRMPRWVNKDSDAKIVGDEAVLIARRSHCPVVIGTDRSEAVKELLAKTNCNIVISDDGLQHYRLERDIEIAVMDGSRGLGNKSLLPAGPLREPPSRLNEVDFVITQQSACSPLDKNKSEKEFFMELQGDTLVSISDESRHISLKEFQNLSVHAVAAIGNPQKFFSSLRRQGLNIVEHVFPDHYVYQAKDFNFSDSKPIVMTEKDAVKCREFANNNFWYLPVNLKIDAEFADAILMRLQTCKSMK